MRYPGVMMSSPTRLGAAAAIVLVLTVPACGTGTRTDRPGAAPSTSAAAVAAHNDADVMFAQMMIPHHQQALELAALVPDRSSDPAVIELAAAIAAEQQVEIDTMRALLVQWDAAGGAGGHAGHGSMPMPGMVDQATLERLETLEGAPFDKLWLTSMINHHRGAVEMARTEVADGENVDLIAMAETIITAQQAEIEQMTSMLGD